MKSLLIQILMALLLGTAAGQHVKELDGTWWLSLSAEERVEFLAGYIDCYANDLGDKNNTFPESWYAYAPRITRYYEQKQPSVNRRVSSVLFDVRGEHPPKPPKGGETWTGKHGFFDGKYWREMGTAEKTALVEGYLACYREHLSSRPKRFSKSAPIYEEKISQWFGAGAARENVAIADVLYRFAEGQE